jgi:hypothetical protein
MTLTLLVFMAQYLFAAAGVTPTALEKKGLAVACMTFIVLCT